MSLTFNGFPIIAVPSTPAPRSLEFSATDIVGASTSPFTGAQQLYTWQTAWLLASVTMPPMRDVQARAWIAFLLACQGMANVFQLGDPLGAHPLGSGSGTPLVNGANQTGITLSTRGWTPGAAGVLLPGDYLQIGYRLYRNLTAATADGSGDATLSIWPNLRESPADGTGITLNNTQGIWRMATNTRAWSLDETRIFGITFKIREAI